MAGPALDTDGIVLLKRPAANAFETLTVFSPEAGALRVLHRVPRQPAPNHVALDLFDDVALRLEAGEGGTWFVREARVQHRPSGIGRRYARLQAASAIAGLIARNPVQEESRPAIHHLLRSAFAALETTDRPDVVQFKSLYRFARDEGHPLKQQWFPTLPATDRTAVIELLNRPVAEQTVPGEHVVRLQRRLEEFLRGHTEILPD